VRPVAIVTGAAGTIGRTIAQELSIRGAALGLTDLDADGLTATRELLPAEGVMARRLDLRDSAQVEQFVVDAVGVLGGLDACVLAAGVTGPIGMAGDATDEALTEVFDVNVIAMFRMLRSVLPIMRERGAGRVVALASGAGLGGAPYTAPYAASKHAVIGLVRSVAVEEAAAGISVNAVCPGLVESPMLTSIQARVRSLTGAPDGAPPIGRNADPVEVAELVAYLALSAPKYLTGSAVTIDGGLRA
jgi:NAD(P)-dependent dehydrogenase (short-subunit alcohol dehydrogenase family)